MSLVDGPEISALKSGLERVWNQRFEKIIVETDSQITIELLNADLIEAIASL